ncbi:hypothetical protein BpHYR1_004257 [Brachionus plicatilis]|uniref:Uncharacterized protein n=1 Tax=Brachionus plicatilis TaxID=10195 RepID=A0A3M7RU08_BRAPC|nr:hypothetical protein BpHYR1_004257 [Brachionus plicatilis]
MRLNLIYIKDECIIALNGLTDFFFITKNFICLRSVLKREKKSTQSVTKRSVYKNTSRIITMLWYGKIFKNFHLELCLYPELEVKQPNLYDLQMFLYRELEANNRKCMTMKNFDPVIFDDTPNI